ncbi:MAG TPA: penicillin-binding transpeptidase domain-containing protein [Acidisarcina sp.]
MQANHKQMLLGPSLVAVFLLSSPLHAQSYEGRRAELKIALSEALKGTQASAVVLDQKAAGTLAEIEPARRGLPGSAIKPLLLAYALSHHIVLEDTQVYCRRNLRVAGRALPCTHPADEPRFTAERALAESCNTWFAEMGKRYSGAQLEDALRLWHLPHQPMTGANLEDRQLVALGLQGVTASPLELAQAYRELLAVEQADGVVVHGLLDSVSYGMARPAAVPGVAILGKTGTASDPGQAWTHGWFAGGIPGRLVLVIYVPHGDGGTAASLAQKFFAHLAAESGAR